MNSIYTCPMHPEVQQDKPGRCPKCGMKLVLKDSLAHQKTEESNSEKQSYTPLVVIISLILLISLTVSFASGFSIAKLISIFMIGFFLIFSGFKLMDLSGFAEGYATYDLFAQKVYRYGYLYPFIELFFALAMILSFQMKVILILEVIVMVFSGIGVAIKVTRHEKFQCACLGTFLKVPLTKVTLIEDFGMAILAVILLLLK